jgi:hypothetical protein
MKDLEVFEFVPLCADWRPMGEGRPEGLHLSDILYGSMYEAKFGKPPGFKNPTGDEQPNVRAQMGFMWERAIDHVWVDFMQQQPMKVDTQLHIQKDGIHMTPDGVEYGGDENILHEYKATWRSLRRWEEDPEEEFITWFWQVKAYCHALGINRCKFFLFFVNGDYRYAKGRGPIVVTQEFEFTDAELEDNWREILLHAKKIKSMDDATAPSQTSEP